jgi:hypothetical protein
MALNQTIRQSVEKVAIEPPEETPHACMDGWVYLGVEDEDDDVVERVPCRRCRPEIH